MNSHPVAVAVAVAAEAEVVEAMILLRKVVRLNLRLLRRILLIRVLALTLGRLHPVLAIFQPNYWATSPDRVSALSFIKAEALRFGYICNNRCASGGLARKIVH
ncbi:MAG: hypothetical protein HRT81_15840 [Henriciella sp.]|nr:hypothetical protein [Henriciella sp.]